MYFHKFDFSYVLKIYYSKYRIAQNFDRGKFWWIWQINSKLSIFSYNKCRLLEYFQYLSRGRTFKAICQFWITLSAVVRGRCHYLIQKLMQLHAYHFDCLVPVCNLMPLHYLSVHSTHLCIPYSTKMWWGKTLVNLANWMSFTNILTNQI